MKIGFIGLGVMGGPMATNLAKDGRFEVTGFDLDSDKVSNLATAGGCAASSVREAATDRDVVMTSLPGPKQIEQVAFDSGLIDSLVSDSCWIDLSTNNQSTRRKLVDAVHSHGASFLDAPVSGGDEGARAGTLTILAGGDREVFERCLPVFEVIGANINHLGSHGAGYAAKIAQVVLCYLHSLALGEAMMLGVKGGVAPAKMLDIIQNSTGKSYVSDRYGPPIVNGDYDPSFTVGLAHKDMRLANEMASDLGIDLPMCELTTKTYARAIEEFGFDANHLKAVRLLEDDHQTYLQQPNSE
ncbi:MAG: NAD(P)-dependent oxidoreductase [Pseudomonadota bacterium]